VCEHAAHQDETEMAAWLGPLAQQQGRVQARHGRRQHPPGYDRFVVYTELKVTLAFSEPKALPGGGDACRPAVELGRTDELEPGRRAPVNLPYSNCIFKGRGRVLPDLPTRPQLKGLAAAPPPQPEYTQQLNKLQGGV
jgi:hypothetical protein